MSIYQSIKDDIALILTTTTGLTITAAHFDIIKFRPATAQESARNTKIYLRFNVAAPIRSEGSAYYDRLDISSLRKVRNPNIAVTTSAEIGVSSYNLLTALRNEYGVVFTTDDLEETFATLVGEDIQILIKAKTTSMGWIGEDTFIFPQVPKLEFAFSNTTLSGF